MWKRRNLFLKPDDDAGGGGAATPAAAPAAAPVAAPAAAPAPAALAPAPAPVASAPAAGPAAAPAADDGKSYWPADWRKTVSKDDAKVLARLDRYASPEAAMHALIAAQNKISSGELKPTLGKDAKPEEVAEYRKAMGIPESADKYDLGNDLALDDDDKATAAELLKAAHATNQTPEQVRATLKAIKALQQTSEETRFESDKKLIQQGEDTLRTEWGPEYRRNLNLIHGLLDGAASPGLKDAFFKSRLPDGTPIGSSPEMLKLMVSLALVQNPTGVVVPGSEANPMKGIGDEITAIEKTMRENRSAYNKDEKMQERYRQLLDAREKIKPRGQAA